MPKLPVFKKFTRPFLWLVCLLLSTGAHAQKQNTKPAPSKVFEKIVFHTGPCFGACPIYHLEVSGKGAMKLHAEHVYKDVAIPNESNENKKKMGYFVGSLNAKKLKALEEAIIKMGPDTVQFNGPNCCDGPVVSIILYYGGKRKAFTAMFPPQAASALINYLNQLCREFAWQRSKNAFTVEDPEAMR